MPKAPPPLRSEHTPEDRRRNRRWFALLALLIVATLLAVALLALLAKAALGHEDYPWVRDPAFLTKSGRHCCSEQHCQPAAPGELTPIPGGWRHNATGLEVHDDEPGIYQTRDKAGRLFRCIYGNELCVFEGIGT